MLAQKAEPLQAIHKEANAYSLSFHASRDPFAPGLISEHRDEIKKVVLLRASRIGDFINATPAVKAFRRALPKAQIDLITLPMLEDMARRIPYLDRILPFPGYPGLAEQFFHPAQAVAFFQEMQGVGYDLAVQMQGSGVYSNPFMLMLGARWTAGFIRENDPAGRLDAALPWPTEGHEVDRVISLAQFLGAQVVDRRPDFCLWPVDRSGAAGLLSGLPKPWIGVHTSARDQTRRWPMENFTQAAALLQNAAGGTIILIGEERDQEALENAFSGICHLNLAGRTSIPVTGAVLQQLSVFLTNDTGPAHIAYAVGTPTVTIFGGGDPNRNGPLIEGRFSVIAKPIACRPCDTGTCPIGYTCLVSVSPQQVVDAALKIIRE